MSVVVPRAGSASDAALQGVEVLLNAGDLLASSAPTGFGAGTDGSRPATAAAVSRYAELVLFGCDRCVRICRLRDLKLKKRETVKILQCSLPLPDATHRMLFSPSANFLAAASFDELYIVATPTDMIRSRMSSDGDSILCRSFPIIGEHTSSLMPPTEILQISWHPSSSHHICVLHADNTFRMFAIEGGSPAVLELTIDLASGDRLHTRRQFTSFAFGQGTGWSQFAVYFLHSRGDVVPVCPVVPRHQLLSLSSYEVLQQSLESSNSPLPREHRRLASHWLGNCWRRRSGGDAFYFQDDAFIREGVFLEVQQPMMVDPPVQLPAHVESDDIRAVCLSSLPSSSPVSALFIGFSSGHVDVLLDIDCIRPLWRDLACRPLSSPSSPSLLALDRVDLRLPVIDNQLSFIPCTTSRDSVYVESSCGLHSIDTRLLRRILSAFESGNISSPPELVRGAQFYSHMLLEMDRHFRSSIDFVSDPFLGQFILAIDSDYRCVLVDTKQEDSSSPSPRHVTSQQPKALEQGPSDEDFNVRPFLPELQAILAKLPSGAVPSPPSGMNLSDAESLQKFMSMAKTIASVVDGVQTLRSTVQDRVHFSQQFASTQMLVLQSLGGAVQRLQQRRQVLKQLVSERKTAVEQLRKRVQNLCESVQQQQNLLSREEREYHSELETVCELLPSLSANAEELQVRAQRTLQSSRKSGRKPWTHQPEFAPLRESHARRLNPVIQQQTESLNECLAEVKKLQSLVNMEFPESIDASSSNERE